MVGTCCRVTVAPAMSTQTHWSRWPQRMQCVRRNGNGGRSAVDCHMRQCSQLGQWAVYQPPLTSIGTSFLALLDVFIESYFASGIDTIGLLLGMHLNSIKNGVERREACAPLLFASCGAHRMRLLVR
jgi:hypothetical protein